MLLGTSEPLSKGVNNVKFRLLNLIIIVGLYCNSHLIVYFNHINVTYLLYLNHWLYIYWICDYWTFLDLLFCLMIRSAMNRAMEKTIDTFLFKNALISVKKSLPIQSKTVKSKTVAKQFQHSWSLDIMLNVIAMMLNTNAMLLPTGLHHQLSSSDQLCQDSD